MAPRRKPTAEDAEQATALFLRCLASDGDVHELGRELAELHPKNDTFPGEVFLRLGADALEVAGVSPTAPLEYEGLGQYLPEFEFRGSEHRKLRFALLATAALHGGVEPDLLDEVIWWQTDDFWHYGLVASVAYIRATADHAGITVPELCARLASRQRSRS